MLEAELFVDINMGAFKPIDGIMTGSETAASQGILRPG